VHCETTSCRVWGDAACAATQEGPCSVPQGERKENRPALKPCVLSMRCVDRAGPVGGKPADGQASDTTLQAPLRSESAQILARHGVAPGA
jgi:hypothetical protein